MKRAALIAALALMAAFVYRPALFGFYGFTERQCIFLHATDAPTDLQSRLAYRYCTN